MFRVLIVDDEPYSIDVVKALGDWEALGLIIVGEALDGKEGLHKIKDFHPEIVITDMRMPGLDGQEFLKRIQDEAAETKVIVMSGYSDFAYLQQAIRSNVVDYLLKPIAPEDLNACLRKCVEELEASRAEKSIPVKVPVALFEGKEMAAWPYLREQLGHSLLEGSFSGIQETLEQMKRLLEQTYPGLQDKMLFHSVGHELLLPLKEFCIKEALSQYLSGEGREGFTVTADSLAEEFAELEGSYRKVMETVAAMRRKNARLDLEAVSAYIDQHYCERISLSTIAQSFFVSREYLSRAFKAYAGETVTDCISRKRLEKARQLMTKEGMSIRNAAEAVGYQDLAYFYRIYKKHFGTTPGETSI